MPFSMLPFTQISYKFWNSIKLSAFVSCENTFNTKNDNNYSGSYEWKTIYLFIFIFFALKSLKW